MSRQVHITAGALVILLLLSGAMAAVPAVGFFFALLSVYIATTATMDAIVDQRCGCAALRRMVIRFSLRTLLIATTLLAVLLGLGVWLAS